MAGRQGKPPPGALPVEPHERPIGELDIVRRTTSGWSLDRGGIYELEHQPVALAADESCVYWAWRPRAGAVGPARAA